MLSPSSIEKHPPSLVLTQFFSRWRLDPLVWRAGQLEGLCKEHAPGFVVEFRADFLRKGKKKGLTYDDIIAVGARPARWAGGIVNLARNLLDQVRAAVARARTGRVVARLVVVVGFMVARVVRRGLAAHCERWWWSGLAYMTSWM